MFCFSLPTAREGNVFTPACHSVQGDPPSRQRSTWTKKPLDRTRPHHLVHLVTATAAVGTRPTEMHSCFLIILGTCKHVFMYWYEFFNIAVNDFEAKKSACCSGVLVVTELIVAGCSL